jgi:16S rRNA (cytosine967-C5)-methyltransferase
MARISAARKAAFEALRRVNGGGLSDVALIEECRGLEARDAGLAHTIVYGVLRHQNQLEFLAKKFSGRKILVLDGTTAILLYMGIFQLRYLTKIPAHAAVMESVELAKRLKKRASAGLINAVLRKVDKRLVKWPDEATELGMPLWLWKRWVKEFGHEGARLAAQAALEPPARKGMDPGAETIVPLLDLQAGQTMLDLCAAPGNKAKQAMGLGAKVIACDRSIKRLMGMSEAGAPLVVLDASLPLPFRRKYEKVLADAPCSGTGTLSRNPEIKWRLTEEDLGRHQARQVAIVREARNALAPGGRLVYSTCSLEKEENEEVIRAACPGEDIPMLRRMPGRDPGDGFFAAVIPART